MDDGKIEITVELEALRQIAGALAGLDDAAIRRVLRWTADRFTAGEVLGGRAGVKDSEDAVDAGRDGDAQAFADVAGLFAATNPARDPDKALVVGYWVQYIEGAAEFDSFTVNKQLKQLGHGVSNITAALDSLKARKPQLVIQTKKSGTSKQARKKYKLTNSGKLAVENMLRGEPGVGS
jgi:hypothetical protein